MSVPSIWLCLPKPLMALKCACGDSNGDLDELSGGDAHVPHVARQPRGDLLQPSAYRDEVHRPGEVWLSQQHSPSSRDPGFQDPFA